MKLDLREFEAFPALAHVECKAGEFSLEYETVLETGKVEVDLTIQRAGEEYYCQGTVRGDMKIECARCLTPYETTVEGQLDFIMCDTDRHTGLKNEADDDEDYVLLEGLNRVGDIGEVTRQALILGLELIPLCSEDCLGLCQECGQNLNQGDCDCRKERVDPRWSGLEELKNKLDVKNKE